MLNSAATPWAGAPFELHQTAPSLDPTPLAPLPGEHHLRVVVRGSYEIVLREGGREVLLASDAGVRAGPRELRLPPWAAVWLGER